MPRKPTGDAVLEAEIERAMRPYRALLPAEMQEVFEDILVMAYTEHPAGQRILGRLRPHAEPGGSGRRAIVKELGDGEEPRADSASQKSARGDEIRGTQSSHRAPGGKRGGQ
jgi:hypothetical protein